tara:strand:- start:28 stop:198 length:171 start_codon:yes stop_codon:yes gene_type:complete
VEILESLSTRGYKDDRLGTKSNFIFVTAEFLELGLRQERSRVDGLVCGLVVYKYTD